MNDLEFIKKVRDKMNEEKRSLFKKHIDPSGRFYEGLLEKAILLKKMVSDSKEEFCLIPRQVLEDYLLEVEFWENQCAGLLKYLNEIKNQKIDTRQAYSYYKEYHEKMKANK